MLNWREEGFIKIFLIVITDYSICQNFAPSNICTIWYLANQSFTQIARCQKTARIYMQSLFNSKYFMTISTFESKIWIQKLCTQKECFHTSSHKVYKLNTASSSLQLYSQLLTLLLATTNFTFQGSQLHKTCFSMWLYVYNQLRILCANYNLYITKQVQLHSYIKQAIYQTVKLLLW